MIFLLKYIFVDLSFLISSVFWFCSSSALVIRDHQPANIFVMAGFCSCYKSVRNQILYDKHRVQCKVFVKHTPWIKRVLILAHLSSLACHNNSRVGMVLYGHLFLSVTQPSAWEWKCKVSCNFSWRKTSVAPFFLAFISILFQIHNISSHFSGEK